MKGFKPDPGSVCFVDTNIWLYSFNESQDKKKSLIAKSIVSGNDIIISTQIINEISVNLLRKANFSEKQIQELIHSLYKKFTVLELSPDILIKVSKIRHAFSFSFWDSVVASCAIDSEADYLLSVHIPQPDF